AALCDNADARYGTRPGEAGGRRDRGGQVSRTAARNSVRREGSAGYGGNRDHIRCGAVSEPGTERRLGGGCPAACSGRRARRKIEHGRARAQRYLVRRSDDESVVAGRRRVRIERGTRCGDLGGARWVLRG